MKSISYAGKTILIASMHQKEDAIGPVITEKLAASFEVIKDFNSDVFGTFSGEIERTSPPIETLRKKIEAAHAITSADLIIGSEGSFGPHPMFFMLPANEEFIMLKDFTNDLEFLGRHITEETNHTSEEIASMDQFGQFCERIGFPSHGIILKIGSKPAIYKDLPREELYSTVETALHQQQTVFAETDMRANRNPTRMKAISKAALNLSERILSRCPNCQTPGFWTTETKSGLPCRICKLPTNSIKSYIYTCTTCDYSEERPNPKKEYEEPTYCDYCNP